MNSRLLGASIVVPILIVSIGLFIYNSASSSITESISSISTQEIDAFNNQFVSYEGEQSGSSVKTLLGRLIANARIYMDESTKIPQVYIDQVSDQMTVEMYATYTEGYDGDTTAYINVLNEIRTNIDNEKSYLIDITYQDSGLIDYIQISYDIENPIWEDKHR